MDYIIMPSKKTIP